MSKDEKNKPTNPTIIAEEQVKKKKRYLQRNEITKVEVQEDERAKGKWGTKRTFT